MPNTSDLVRSSADLLVLSVLDDGPLYGYAISKRVATQSGDQIRLTAGVLYPLLHRMEKQGLLLASWDAVQAEGDARSVPPRNARAPARGASRGTDSGSGRKRKWYRLSAKGRRRLAQRVAAHRAYQAIVESFLPGGRAARRAGGEGAR